jgi:DNA primase
MMLSSIEKVYATLINTEYQQTLFSGLGLFQRKGTGFISCCPFHKDPLATFLIYGDRPEYFCFACSDRGDWIKYLRQKEGLSFQDALNTLERASDISIRDYSEEQWEIELFRTKILESAMDLFITQLWSKPGEEVLHYLYTRGYAMAEIEGMSLGYNPGFTKTMQGLLKQGFNQGHLDTTLSGLWKSNPDSPGLAIPFRDASGRLMGLIHKDIRTNGSSSYCLLTDFSCLDDIPFLMYRSRGQEEVIVVEGFFDALILDQARLKPVIGIGIGGMKAGQIQTAAFLGTRRFILALGSSELQIDATRAAISLIKKLELTASVLPIPTDYKDLDEFIRMNCLDHFKTLLKKAQSSENWLASHK